jgi:hypothetical protein
MRQIRKSLLIVGYGRGYGNVLPDWTRAPAWLQCVARFLKDKLNE